MLTSTFMAHSTRPAPAVAAQATAWETARLAWLAAKRARSGSTHTVRAYIQDYTDFFAFAGKAPWLIVGSDAAAWLHYLRETGKAPATINRKLATLSSFYAFVIAQSESGLFAGAHGSPRANPFERPERVPVEAYATAHALAADVVRACLQRINQRTSTGARDYALITAFVFTGRRSAEVTGLRWKDLDNDAARARVYYTWSSKDGHSRTDELPQPAWRAICAYLSVTGRLADMQPDDFIFRAVFTDRAERLPNVRHHDVNRPLSDSMIRRIVKRRFACAGVDPATIGTHTLRHTAAALRYRDGKGQDVSEISNLLNHSSLAVTQKYLKHRPKPADFGWTEVEQLLSL